MPLYQRPRGTLDILPDAAEKWRRLERFIAQHSTLFGFGEIRTPIFEETELFTRTSGASSDVVRKEMYTFTDRGGRSLTLRPEGTAGAGRAYLENGLASAPQPVKLWYLGPMFRYDRPQAGRYRQHTQYGIEIFGAASPLADAEVILVAWGLLSKLGLARLAVHLNSIGCRDCRPAYRQRLVEYFGRHVGELCDDCRDRYEANPLRIFDCKNEHCRTLLADAPVSAESLCPDCRRHLERVKELLAALDVRYTDDPYLVRGLDYYTRTVFEVVYQPSAARAAAQDVVCGGGRYDGLIEELGGASTPGVGFGLGLERLLAILDGEGLVVPSVVDERPGLVFIGAIGPAAAVEGFRLAQQVRRAGYAAVNDLLERSVKAQFKAADRLGARFVVLVGEDELAAGVATVRDLQSGEQRKVPLAEVAASLAPAAVGLSN